MLKALPIFALRVGLPTPALVVASFNWHRSINAASRFRRSNITISFRVLPQLRHPFLRFGGSQVVWHGVRLQNENYLWIYASLYNLAHINSAAPRRPNWHVCRQLSNHTVNRILPHLRGQWQYFCMESSNFTSFPNIY